MRTLACSSSLFLLLTVACTPDEGDGGGGGGTMPTGAASSSDGEVETNGVPTTDEPGTTGPGPSTTTMATTDGGSLDSSGSESGETSAGGPPGDWLLTIDNGSSPPRLVRADLAGGVVEICTLAGSVTYTSMVFERDGTLFAYNAAANRIDIINPCNCSFQILGPTSVGAIALGLGPEGGDELLALEPALDALVRVDETTALATVIGPLGFIFEGSAIAWSDAIGQPYAVEGANDFLYTVVAATGEAVPSQPLTQDVTNPGLAVHPNDNGLYVCDGNTLYTLDPTNGLMVPIGPLGLTGTCQTLAAPRTALDCIDAR